MKKVVKKVVCILLLLVMVISTACSKTKEKETPSSNVVDEQKSDPTTTPSNNEAKEIVKIRIGTHYVQELDPHYTDEVTGEYVMTEAERQARLAAEQAILDELGVVFEYVQYPGDTREVLLQSVMANDPICELAWMWGGSEGTVLTQNVLQKLDDYTHLFEDEESSWMLYDKVFGHNYFLGTVIKYTQCWPLVYNIDYIEAVDSLKDENGNTIYPNTLFDEGKWTWSTFKDYLKKIDAYYANSTAPKRPERRIDAYQTDYRYAALSAIYAAGGSIYGPDGLQVNSEETKKGVKFIADLKKEGLLWTETWDEFSISPGWTYNGDNFIKGETVFTDIPDWFINGATAEAAERGESIGIVPWPREDSLSIDSEKYRQVMTVSNCIGVLKGISPEKTELSLKALRLFYQTYYTQLAGVEKMADLRNAYASTQAAAMGFDIFHEKAGDSVLESFKYIANKVIGNDLADLVGIKVSWDDIVANSLYGANGSPAYDIAIEANMSIFDTIISDTTSILSKEGANDNVKPNVKTVYDAPLAIPVGTTLEDPIWSEYIYATDNIDGNLDFSTMEVEFNYEVDYNTIGLNNRAFKAYFEDKSGNRNYKTISFVVYDPNNTVAPTITTIAEAAPIAVDTNVADIVWLGSFVESALDANGLDISRNIVADISELDTTTPGTYEVKITVTDFVGNTTDTVVTVEVAKAE